MADRLTQLQDAVDQLANQFVASIFWVSKHHELKKLSPTDQIRVENKAELDPTQVSETDVDPLPEDVFKAGQLELAQDLIMKEQEIEMLITKLPGVDNSERDQEQMIRQLEEELKISEEERKEAVREKEVVLVRLENVIRNIKRPSELLIYG